MEGVDLPRDAVHAENLSLQRLKLLIHLITPARMMVAGLFDIAGTYSLDLGPLEFDSINGVLAYLAPQTRQQSNTLA